MSDDTPPPAPECGRCHHNVSQHWDIGGPDARCDPCDTACPFVWTDPDDQQHHREQHPDFEYATTTRARKSLAEAAPPEGEGWILNTAKGDYGWERFEYHEEDYWRRPKPDEPVDDEIDDLMAIAHAAFLHTIKNAPGAQARKQEFLTRLANGELDDVPPGANAEDCPHCGNDLPYPWICPGHTAAEIAAGQTPGRCPELIGPGNIAARCERPFNHDDIHETQLGPYSFLRWSYAGRRVLPLTDAPAAALPNLGATSRSLVASGPPPCWDGVRRPVDQLGDDQLDALYDEIETLRSARNTRRQPNPECSAPDQDGNPVCTRVMSQPRCPGCPA